MHQCVFMNYCYVNNRLHNISILYFLCCLEKVKVQLNVELWRNTNDLFQKEAAE